MATAEQLEIRARWLAALRSGEHKQTTQVLTRVAEDGTLSHCCLGLLCQLVGARKVASPGRISYGIPSCRPATSSSVILPESVMKLAGMKTMEGGISEELTLASANDSGKTFSEIADLIEENEAILFE